MSVSVILMTIFLSMIPISELRGAIPYAVLGHKMPIIMAYIISVLANALVGPAVFIFLSSLHKVLVRWKAYNTFFDKFVERTRKKIHAPVEKYGYLGIAIFVAIPLPITGAYTGALGAWVLGMEKYKSMLACALGVVVSGIIVSVIVYFGPETFKFLYSLFVKAPV